MRAFPKYESHKVRNRVQFARQLQDTHVFSKTRKAFALLPYKDLMTMYKTNYIWTLLVFFTSMSWAVERPVTRQGFLDPTQISLEDLLKVEVISITKRPESRTEVAAAIYVITQDDIRRSGVTSLPEALRLAPGVQVARIDANKWAIGVRGFASRLSRSLLVLIDGRSVYSPLFAGVYWEVQDTLLEDVDRIEVIRGPGGTIWGANAVNGVINIITKKAQETQGGLLVAGGGSEEQGFGGVRYGGKSARISSIACMARPSTAMPPSIVMGRISMTGAWARRASAWTGMDNTATPSRPKATSTPGMPGSDRC